MTLELNKEQEQEQEQEGVSRKLTDLEEDPLESIINFLDVNALSRLTTACSFFRNEGDANTILQQRREQEYNAIRCLLNRYRIPMPLDHPTRFQVNLIKSASIVETQIRKIEKSNRGLLFQHNNLTYLFYTQLPVEGIRAGSLDLALKYYNNDLASWLIRSENQPIFQFSSDTLQSAAYSGNLELVQWLMHAERGDDRVRPEQGALNSAARSGNQELVQWLVDAERGADRVRPEQGALNSAARSGNQELVQWLVDAERGADRVRPEQGALNSAARSGNQELVQWLVDAERGADRVRPEQGALNSAARSGNQELVQWLVDAERGADRVRPEQGALNSAARSGNQELVQWLVDAERGADRVRPNEWTLYMLHTQAI